MAEIPVFKKKTDAENEKPAESLSKEASEEERLSGKEGLPESPVTTAARTARWVVTMTKVRIRQVAARTKWQLMTFYGPNGGESVGIVDMIAIRKDFRDPPPGMKKGDPLRIILIQVKGGSASKPTADDGIRLRAVAERHHAEILLLAAWKKGSAVDFYRLDPNDSPNTWIKIKTKARADQARDRGPRLEEIFK